MKKLVYALAALVLLGLAAVILRARQPETTSAIRGKRLAEALGCFACHGPEGSGGVAEPKSPGGTVPDWRSPTLAMFVQSEQDIREWILYGAPRGTRRTISARSSRCPATSRT